MRLAGLRYGGQEATSLRLGGVEIWTAVPPGAPQMAHITLAEAPGDPPGHVNFKLTGYTIPGTDRLWRNIGIDSTLPLDTALEVTGASADFTPGGYTTISEFSGTRYGGYILTESDGTTVIERTSPAPSVEIVDVTDEPVILGLSGAVGAEQAEIGDVLTVTPATFTSAPGVVTTSLLLNGTPVSTPYTVLLANLGGVVSAQSVPTVGPTSASLGYPVVHVPPAVTGSLANVTYDYNTGNQTVAAAAAFNGLAIVYSVLGTNVAINDGTGAVTIGTDTTRADSAVIVTATNTGGSASVGFTVTVEGEPIVTDASVDSTLSVADVDIAWEEPVDIFYSISPAVPATVTTANTQIADVPTGLSVFSIDTSALAPGTWYFNVAARDADGGDLGPTVSTSFVAGPTQTAIANASGIFAVTLYEADMGTGSADASGITGEFV